MQFIIDGKVTVTLYSCRLYDVKCVMYVVIITDKIRFDVKYDLIVDEKLGRVPSPDAR